MPRLVAISLLALILVSCNEHPRGTLTPAAVAPAPGTVAVSMLVATTRSNVGAVPGEMFTGERGSGLSYADITISIPPDWLRKFGEIQWPNPAHPNPNKEFVPVEAAILTATSAIEQLDARTKRTPDGQVLLFVHGYNTGFEEAVYRLAQIVRDSGMTASPVLFTWPSAGKPIAYDYDRNSAIYSRDALEAFLQILAKDVAIRQISVLSHSMGNWLTLEALRQMSIRNKGLPIKIKNVMLVDPDENYDVFQRQIAEIGIAPSQFTIFVSKGDETPTAANRSWSDVQVKDLNPEQEPYQRRLIQDRIKVIDLTAAKDPLGHSTFAGAPMLVRAIGAFIIAGGKLSEERIMSMTVSTTIGYLIQYIQKAITVSWQFLKDNWVQITGLCAAIWAVFKYLSDKKIPIANSTHTESANQSGLSSRREISDQTTLITPNDQET